ncbi:integrase, catalytic region, zinc finger, CCHC-type containing protein [Tanacetum coccineum]|uniref:Integrase, catalytic region, zinc finger, CCHC-type containing protein n=1 Tax=Tanacetum coccineum TaxID=301880 RepID=A0ABQ4XS90_9ASTR
MFDVCTSLCVSTTILYMNWLTVLSVMYGICGSHQSYPFEDVTESVGSANFSGANLFLLMNEAVMGAVEEKLSKNGAAAKEGTSGSLLERLPHTIKAIHFYQGMARISPSFSKEAQQDSMILSVIEQMSEQMINHVNNWEKANKEQNNESITAELERYKERVKTFEQRLNIDLSSREKMIDSQMDDMIKEKLALKEKVDSLEQNLSKQIKEKESLLQTFNVFKNEAKEKENKYQENEIDLEKKIKELDNIVYKVGQSTQTVHMLTKPQSFYDNIHKQALELSAEQAFRFRIVNPTIEPSYTPPVIVDVPSELPKVSLVNASLKKLKFHLTQFDSVVRKRTTPSALEEGEWGFEHTKTVFNNEIIPFLKSLKDIFNVFDKDLLNEITEVQTVFDQMDAAVQQSSVDKQCLEIAKKEILLENDRLLQKIMSQDVMLTVMNSMSLNNDSVNMEMQECESCEKCLNLDAELSKSKQAYNDFLKNYSQLEKHCISLEASMQLQQEVFQNDESCVNQNAVEIQEYFEINDLKARLQDKDKTICKLKATIKSLRENTKEENVNPDKCDLEPINKELENSVAKLLSENERLCNEINHVKQVFKDQFDSIKQTRVRHKEQSDSLINKLNLKSVENEDLKAQIQDKVFVITSLKNDLRKLKGKEIVENVVHTPSATTIAPGMFKLDLEPLPPSELDFACKYTTRIQELLVYVPDTCPNAITPSAKKVTVKPMNNVKKVRSEVITSTNVVPPKQTTSHSDEIQKPEIKVYSRKSKNVRNIGCPDCTMVSGLWMIETHDRESLSAHELCFEELPKTPTFHDDPLNESPHEDSTSQGSSTNVRQLRTPFKHLVEPKNFKQAMTEPSWIDAMQEEIHEFKRLEVWELVPCPDNVFLIKLKWIYKVKTNESGEVLKNKAQLVAQGFRQEEGIDFE